MRADWETLPPTARAAVETRTGPVLKAEPVSDGTANQFTAVLRPADGPAVFCKGVHGTGPHLRMLRAEHTIGPHLGGLAPTVLWRAGADDWALLGFEYLPGRSADLGPGSPDLPLVADALARVQQLSPCPPVPTLPLADRWARFPAWSQLAEQPPAGLDSWAAEHLGDLAMWEQRAPEAVDGDTLAHCDLAWNNMLIEPGAAVRLVDWALAGRAAAWVDTAFMALRLIQYGHTPRDAETWAQQVPGWPGDDAPVTAFAAAVAGIRAHRASAVDAPAHMPQLAAAALSWARYLLG